MSYPSDPGHPYPQQPASPGGYDPYSYPGQPQAPGYAYAPPGYGQAPPPGYGTPPGYPAAAYGPALASWGARLGAYLIDGFIVSLMVMLIYVGGVLGTLAAVAAVSPETLESDTMPVPVIIAFVVSISAAMASGFCYYWLMHAKSGQTLGKKMLRIKVLSLHTGQPPSKGASAARYGIHLAFSFVPMGQLLDGLWPLWDQPYQQALHDKVAKTYVVQV